MFAYILNFGELGIRSISLQGETWEVGDGSKNVSETHDDDLLCVVIMESPAVLNGGNRFSNYL